MGSYINQNLYEEHEGTSKHLVFSVNGCACAINVSFVRKIIKLSDISPLQKSESYILGYTETDGALYTVADLRIFFGADIKELSTPSNAVLLVNGKSVVCVVVDEVISVIDIDTEPSTCLFNKNPCVSGIVQTNNGSIILLSADNLLSLLLEMMN